MSGILANNSLSPGFFPSQKRAWSKKGKAFFKECVDAGVGMSGWQNSGKIRNKKSAVKSNYDLINNEVSAEEMKAVVNPFRIQGFDPTVNYQNYPLINANLAVLIGEERKRIFKPLVAVLNSDVINENLEFINNEFTQYTLGKLTENNFDEAQTEKEIADFGRWKNFTYRDKRARMVSQTMEYLTHTLEIGETFSRGYEDLMIGDEEIFVTDIVAGEPVLRKGNPLNFTAIRSGESNKIEDSDIIIEDGYKPVGAVLDDYHEYLTDTEVKKIEDGNKLTGTGGSILFRNQLLNQPIDYTDFIEAQGGIGELLVRTDSGNTNFAGAFDADGNVRVVRVLWKSMRKVGFITYYDEDGNEEVRKVDEGYKVRKDLGEEVAWRWISEWYEGTRIADDIYVKMQPREIQFRSMTNPSICYPGIVGTVFNINSSKAQSFVSLLKPFQLTFNAFMHKLKKAFAKHKGNLPIINSSMIPEGWTMDEWMYYAEELGYGVYNPFNTGSKGAALGKLAGNMSQMQSNINADQSSIIQSTLVMLEFLKQQIDELSGVTPQRKGAVENRETVGGVERSVTQSSLNTEKYFALHENTKLRVIRALVETAKVAWEGKKFKRTFIMDDSSQGILDFDSEVFNESEYGIYITNALEHREMLQMLRSLSQAFMQNGGTLSMVANLYTTTDPTSLQRKMETFEEQLRSERENARKQQLESESAAAQEQNATIKEKLRIEEEKNIRDAETKIYIAELGAKEKDVEDVNFSLPTETEKFEEDKRKNREDLDLKKEDLNEKIRSNKAKESIARKTKTITSKK